MAKAIVSDMEGPLYHVTPAWNRRAILNAGIIAKGGSQHGVTWKRRVFLVTNRFAAYEMAYDFMHERHVECTFILVDPARMKSKLRPDKDCDHGVWTGADVPASALIGSEDVDKDFFDSKEFLVYMALKAQTMMLDEQVLPASLPR